MYPTFVLSHWYNIFAATSRVSSVRINLFTMGPKKLPKVQKDHYARTSYLFQAASFHTIQGNAELARMMARALDLVSKRAVLRLLPHLKRRICKTCKTVLIPGLTMAQEIENPLQSSLKSEVLVCSCMCCLTKRRYPIGQNPDYTLFCDKSRVK